MSKINCPRPRGVRATMLSPDSNYPTSTSSSTSSQSEAEDLQSSSLMGGYRDFANDDERPSTTNDRVAMAANGASSGRPGEGKMEGGSEGVRRAGRSSVKKDREESERLRMQGRQD